MNLMLLTSSACSKLPELSRENDRLSEKVKNSTGSVLTFLDEVKKSGDWASMESPEARQHDQDCAQLERELKKLGREIKRERKACNVAINECLSGCMK